VKNRKVFKINKRNYSMGKKTRALKLENLARGHFKKRLECIESAISNAGDYPVVFLDTGAIILWENWLRKLRSADSSLDTEKFFNELNLIASRTNSNIYVPSGILEEIESHNKNNRINGFAEISDDAFNYARNFNQRYSDFLEFTKNFRDPGKIKLDTYWVTKFCFEKGHKKNEIDPVSLSDRELISSALLSRYAYVSETEMYPEKRVTGSVIFSTDSHISRAIEVLTDRDREFIEKYSDQIFGYEGLDCFLMEQ
jgi:hypothetical protein